MADSADVREGSRLEALQLVQWLQKTMRLSTEQALALEEIRAHLTATEPERVEDGERIAGWLDEAVEHFRAQAEVDVMNGESQERIDRWCAMANACLAMRKIICQAARLRESQREDGEHWHPRVEGAEKAFPGACASMAKVQARLCGDRPWDPDFHDLQKRVRNLMRQALSEREEPQHDDPEPYEHPEHGLTCPIGGCSLTVESGDEGTCHYRPTLPDYLRPTTPGGREDG